MRCSEITILGLALKGANFVYITLYIVFDEGNLDLCNSMIYCNAFDGFLVFC